MDKEEAKISRAEFEINLTDKLKDRAFIGDIAPLLRYDVDFVYDPLVEGEYIRKKIIKKLQVKRSAT